MLSLCATILAAAALYFARSVFVPVAFSMLAIAMVWPFQQLLETKIPKLLASTVVIFTTLLVIVALAWGFSMIGEWLAQNTGKFQSLHLNATWGVPGAFIGVPVTIALLTCCEAYPSTRWIAMLLSGRAASAQL
jgi:AI-2 transport protein TqsA